MLSGKTSANSAVVYYYTLLGGVCFKSIVSPLNYKQAFL